MAACRKNANQCLTVSDSQLGTDSAKRSAHQNDRIGINLQVSHTVRIHSMNIVVDGHLRGDERLGVPRSRDSVSSVIVRDDIDIASIRQMEAEAHRMSERFSVCMRVDDCEPFGHSCVGDDRIARLEQDHRNLRVVSRCNETKSITIDALKLLRCIPWDQLWWPEHQ